MKKNKIIGIAIALAGMAISFGGAIALYTKGVDNVGFGFGGVTYTQSTSTVTYKINNASSPTVEPSYLKKDGKNGGTKLNDVYRHVKYEYTLGAEFANDITAQDYLLGNLAVSFTNLHASLQGKIQVSMYFEGYVSNSLGAHYFGSNLTTGTGDDESAINNTVVSGASLSVNARDIAVAASGVQKLVVYIALDDSVDVLAMNEDNSLWTLGVTWGAKSNDYGAAYVANTKTLWAKDDEFIMSPNINKAYSEGWEWIAQVTGDAKLSQGKCMHDNGTWANGDNLTFANGTKYNVYWNGNGDSSCSASVYGA